MPALGTDGGFAPKADIKRPVLQRISLGRTIRR